MRRATTCSRRRAHRSAVTGCRGRMARRPRTDLAGITGGGALSTPITGLHHAAVNVSDWDRSIRFYRDVLGLELVFGDGDASGAGLDENTRLDGVHLRFGMFRCGSDFFELI